MTENVASDKILRDYVMKDQNKAEIFHSSGYGEAQNGEHIGTSSTGLSMAERKALEEKRQFIAKYNNSGMFSEGFSNRQRSVRKFNTSSNSGIRTDRVGDANGNVRGSYGRTEGMPGDSKVKKLGGTDGYTPFKTGSTPSSRPTSFASIKPSFK